eukprot:scaffold44004_cov47-Attheya_sp.AAC.1
METPFHSSSYPLFVNIMTLPLEFKVITQELSLGGAGHHLRYLASPMLMKSQTTIRNVATSIPEIN